MQKYKVLTFLLLIAISTSSCYLNKKIDSSRLSADDRALLDTLRTRIYKSKNKKYSFQFHYPVSPAPLETAYINRALEFNNFIEFIESKKTGSHYPITGITYKMIKVTLGNPSRTIHQGKEALIIYYDLDFGYNCNKEKKR